MIVPFETLTFTIPGTPVVKARHRTRKDGHIYPGPKSHAYEKVIKAYAAIAMGNKEPMTGPFYVKVTGAWRWPKNTPQKVRNAPYGFLKTTKPDGDNLAKIVGDACNKIIWKDDGQVAIWKIVTRYSDEPYLRVRVERP